MDNNKQVAEQLGISEDMLDIFMFAADETNDYDVLKQLNKLGTKFKTWEALLPAFEREFSLHLQLAPDGTFEKWYHKVRYELIHKSLSVNLISRTIKNHR